MINHVVVVGRLTKKPELKFTANGTNIRSSALQHSGISRIRVESMKQISLIA